MSPTCYAWMTVLLGLCSLPTHAAEWRVGPGGAPSITAALLAVSVALLTLGILPHFLARKAFLP